MAATESGRDGQGKSREGSFSWACVVASPRGGQAQAAGVSPKDFSVLRACHERSLNFLCP